MLLRALLLVALASWSGGAEARSILVVSPRMTFSHSHYLGAMADLLTDAGHNVTVLISAISDMIPDGTRNSRVVYSEPPADAKAKDSQIREKTWLQMRRIETGDAKFYEVQSPSLLFSIFMTGVFGDIFSQSCRALLADEGLMTQLTAAKFDVVITENFNYCGMGLSHVLQPRATIQASALYVFGDQRLELGMPRTPSFVPHEYNLRHDPHSIVSRFWNLYAEGLNSLLFAGITRGMHQVFVDKYGADFPSLHELSSRVALAFYNSEPLLDYAHATLHRIVPLPGLTACRPRPLDQYWNGVLGRRARTVLISFGSVARSVLMPADRKAAVLAAVAAFPDVTFIWKYEELEDDFALSNATKLENLVLTKWMPQTDLLHDNRLVAFISNAGMGSVQETARAGVPALFIPLFADHPKNAAMMEKNGLARVLTKFELPNARLLVENLRLLLEDPAYLTRSRDMARRLAAKPFSSRELLLKHVDFVAQFGAIEALRPASIDMSYIEYFNLDLIAIGLLIVLLLGYGIFRGTAKCIGNVMITKQKML